MKPGEVSVFQMLNGVPNPEPDEKERAKQGLVLYPKTQVMTSFRIYDKDKQSEGSDQKGEYVDMVLAEGWMGDNPSRQRCFVPGNENGLSGSRFQGKFQCVGGIVREEELFEMLWLSPQRKGTPCPDSSVEQIFEMVDLKADSKSSTNKFNTLKKVIDILDKITEEDARRVMRALNQPDYQDKEVLIPKVREFGKNNVDLFLQTYESKDSAVKADIRNALDAGVLSHDLATGEVKLGGMKIADFKTQSTATFVDEFTRWIDTATNGKDVHANIKNQLEAKSETK